jgi:hypothetical protein
MDDYPDHLAGSENFEPEAVSQMDRIDELESRVVKLETRVSEGLTFTYALGMAIAVVLSWSRNHSILWCILHGALSFTYVVYFAFTR